MSFKSVIFAHEMEIGKIQCKITHVCLKSQELFQDTLTLEHLKSNLLHTTPTFFLFSSDSHKFVKIKMHLRHRSYHSHTKPHNARYRAGAKYVKKERGRGTLAAAGNVQKKSTSTPHPQAQCKIQFKFNNGKM